MNTSSLGEKMDATMNYAKSRSSIRIFLSLVVFVSSSLACNLTNYLAPAKPMSTPDLKATAAVALAATFTAQGPVLAVITSGVAIASPISPGIDTQMPSTEAPVMTISPAAGGTPVTLTAALSLTADACALIPAAQVEVLLGEPLGQPSSSPGVCVTAGQSGQRSFTVVLQPVDNAKPGLLGTIAQFEELDAAFHSVAGQISRLPPCRRIFRRFLPSRCQN